MLSFRIAKLTKTRGTITVCAAGLLFVAVGVAYAGSLTPTSSPGATSYTLTDIYTRLTTNATATEGSHAFAPTGSPAGTLHTLKEVYQAIPTINSAKVLSGTIYLGVTGTAFGDTNSGYVLGTATVPGRALKDMFDGTGLGFAGGNQANGGVDDYNNASGVTDGYANSWTQCTSGNSYCGTGDTGAQARDNYTGLIWSKNMNSSTYALDNTTGTLTWYIANNCTESSGSTCTKKTSAKTGCEANSGWYLPHQKQAMMAYIDNSYSALNTFDLIWTATTKSTTLTNADTQNLGTGLQNQTAKTSAQIVRCVRSS